MESHHQQDSTFLLGLEDLSGMRYPKFVHQMQSPPNHIDYKQNVDQMNMQKGSSER